MLGPRHVLCDSFLVKGVVCHYNCFLALGPLIALREQKGNKGVTGGQEEDNRGTTRGQEEEKTKRRKRTTGQERDKRRTQGWPARPENSRTETQSSGTRPTSTPEQGQCQLLFPKNLNSKLFGNKPITQNTRRSHPLVASPPRRGV